MMDQQPMRNAAGGVPSSPAPNFIVIGPGKSGTTWMYRLLRGHPDVFMPETKETLFFDRFFDRGIDWYLEFFAESGEFEAVGEISNTYIFSEEAARRIQAFDPDIKLISCLRNPIERAFSHYLFLVRNGIVAEPFEDVLEYRPDLIEKGLYSQHLTPYLERFGRNQLLVLKFDDLKEDDRAFAKNIFRFLQVDADIFPQEAEERALGASRPRNRWIALLAKRTAVWLRRFGFPVLLSRIKRSPLVRRLLYKPFDEKNRPEMSAGVRQRLVEYYREDVDRLSDMLDVDFSTLWDIK